MARILGVLVAGGQGRRLGAGIPKALVEIAGVTLLDRSLAVLGQLCDEVIVTAPRTRDLPIPAAQRVDDLTGFDGALSGLIAGLGARPYDQAIVLGVDLPLMRAGALRALADMLEPPLLAVVPAPGSIPQPFAAVYAPAAHPRLRERIEAGERAAVAAVLTLEPRLVVDDSLVELDGGVENFFNVNRPEHLDAARRLIAASGNQGVA